MDLLVRWMSTNILGGVAGMSIGFILPMVLASFFRIPNISNNNLEILGLLGISISVSLLQARFVHRELEFNYYVWLVSSSVVQFLSYFFLLFLYHGKQNSYSILRQANIEIITQFLNQDSSEVIIFLATGFIIGAFQYVCFRTKLSISWIYIPVTSLAFMLGIFLGVFLPFRLIDILSLSTFSPFVLLFQFLSFVAILFALYSLGSGWLLCRSITRDRMNILS